MACPYECHQNVPTQLPSQTQTPSLILLPQRRGARHLFSLDPRGRLRLGHSTEVASHRLLGRQQLSPQHILLNLNASFLLTPKQPDPTISLRVQLGRPLARPLPRNIPSRPSNLHASSLSFRAPALQTPHVQPRNLGHFSSAHTRRAHDRLAHLHLRVRHFTARGAEAPLRAVRARAARHLRQRAELVVFGTYRRECMCECAAAVILPPSVSWREGKK